MAYKDIILQDGPFCYWRLGETSGTTFVDEMGRANMIGQGRISLGQDPQQGTWSNKSALFHGIASSYAECASTNWATLVPNNSGVTFEVWLKPTSMPSGHKMPLAFFGNFNYLSINEAAAYVSLKVSGGQVTLSGTNSMIAAGNWYHVVATWDGTRLRMYTNGVIDTTGAGAAGTTDFQNGIARIGQYTDGTSFFPGYIDEVAFYTYALTPQQILNHYRAKDIVDTFPVTATTQAYGEPIRTELPPRTGRKNQLTRNRRKVTPIDPDDLTMSERGDL